MTGRDRWDERIRRAAALAAHADGSSALLTAYGELLAFQQHLAEALARPPSAASGDLARDSGVLVEMMPRLLRAVVANGPAPLAAEARALLAADATALRTVLMEYWHHPTDRQFFAKAVVQPYAQSLAEAGIQPLDRQPATSERGCPFCGGAPQLSILQSSAGPDGANRALLCATCLTPWPFRRVVCAWCGEEDEHKLAYWHSPAFEHLRVDACETCGRYLKCVDRTRLGIAVPLVDEVAGVPLDVWARDRGYQKIELNLLGM